MIEVRVNGGFVWDESGPHNVPGITYVGSSASYLSFEADPGSWSFVTRSNPAGIFSNGFDSGDATAWQ